MEVIVGFVRAEECRRPSGAGPDAVDRVSTIKESIAQRESDGVVIVAQRAEDADAEGGVRVRREREDRRAETGRRMAEILGYETNANSSFASIFPNLIRILSSNSRCSYQIS